MTKIYNLGDLPKTKKRKGKGHYASMTEHDKMCAEVVLFAQRWERRLPCLEHLFHVANEGKRNPYWAKCVGIRSGIPDFCLPVATARHIGFWLEMKTRGDEPTEAQHRWLENLRRWGHQTHWTDDLNSAFVLLKTYAIEAMEYEKLKP